MIRDGWYCRFQAGLDVCAARDLHGRAVQNEFLDEFIRNVG
jgi:hypothetical protein